MSDEQSEIKVFESNRFSKAINKLSKSHLCIVEDEIDKVIENPEIGVQKVGDLAHLRVHKFKIKQQQVLLGYRWIDSKLELYLLQLGSHENFYKKMKESRKADRKLSE